MKALIPFFTLVLFTLVNCQGQDMPGLDASPMDVSFYPAAFAHQNKDGGDPMIKIYYGRPQKKGRTIFGDLVPYGKVWRTGANESNEITFFKDAVVGGKKVPAGSYSLFTIPNKDSWTIILNKEVNEWGAYSYDESKDLVRFDVPTQKTDKTIEALAIQFADKDGKPNMMIAWDDTMVSVPIEM